MITLKTFNRRELEGFISSGDFQQYDFLPITRHRALSHIQNPKASDKDVLLILAFSEEKLVGYVGCFPDCFTIDGKEIRYAWLSTLYVNPEYRKKRPAKALLKRVFEEYEDRIAITEFTKEAEALYNIMGVFEYVFPKEGIRYYFRTDAAKMIPEKKPGTKPLKPLFKILDATANGLISIKNFTVSKPDFKYEVLDQIDKESADFINGFSGKRDADEINTFINHPWVLEGKKDEKYLFSSFAETFKYFWIKIFDKNNKLTSCFLLQLRDGYLKIPYLFVDSNADEVARFLKYFIVNYRVKGFTSYQTLLNKEIQQSKVFSTIYERDFKREYLFHKNLLELLPDHFDPNYQDGDGDCMMT
ncbi:GNAT family N-acetyltransferase [Chryseobacterium sp. ES2]|uniref:GNAT family N-acetyltransferase n=1 Tax=Chryseobacterium metallicongregator TaxID=3073042 RepID=A0ABU1E2R8_9FLAO|nr:GNAT family N-acetyltransferase [Chryseobacterium sp. ES2]MDR4952065.1 GNAT family N-acetyltransferase [Chryseobacterium sp. ES2]